MSFSLILAATGAGRLVAISATSDTLPDTRKLSFQRRVVLKKGSNFVQQTPFAAYREQSPGAPGRSIALLLYCSSPPPDKLLLRMINARRSDILGGGLIVLIVFVLYWPILRGGFIFDDQVLIGNSSLMHAHNALYRIWFTSDAPDYWPISYSAWWAEWRLFGDNAAGYHIVNVAFHAVDSLLIWLVLRRLNIPGAWPAALLFAIHPVNVASAAWISEQKNTFSMFFYAISIWCYLWFDEREGRKWYAASLIGFALALLSKTSIVMEPIVLLGCAWWRRRRIDRRDVLRSLPFFALSLAAACVTILQQKYGLMPASMPKSGNLPAQLAMACRVLWFYLGKTLSPLNLMMIYPNWTIDPARWTAYIPVAGVIGCAGLLWWKRNGWGRPLLFGLGYFAVTLFPVLGFFRQAFHVYSHVADQWLYAAMTGVLALVSAGAVNAWRRASAGWRRVGMGAAVAVFVLLGLATWHRNPVFASQEALWSDTIQRNPDAWIAYNNLGVHLAGQGKLDEAMGLYRRALQLKPDYVDGYTNLGNVFAAQGKPDDAIACYMQALQLMPIDPDAHAHLAEIYWQEGNQQEAIAHWEMALQVEPDSTDVLNNLAWALATADPSQGGDPAKGVLLAKYVCDLTGGADPSYLDTLSVAQAAAGQFTDAVATAQKALDLARAAGQTELAGKIESRLDLFRVGQAFHPSTHQSTQP
jgi:protein O-mannosyl-transferase